MIDVEIFNAPKLDTIRSDNCLELKSVVLQGVPDSLNVDVDPNLIELDEEGHFTVPETDD